MDEMRKRGRHLVQYFCRCQCAEVLTGAGSCCRPGFLFFVFYHVVIGFVNVINRQRSEGKCYYYLLPC